MVTKTNKYFTLTQISNSENYDKKKQNKYFLSTKSRTNDEQITIYIFTNLKLKIKNKKSKN